MKEASYYEKGINGLKCTLCPHFCQIKEGKVGSCRVRKNIGGKLIAENYEQLCSMRSDPIEKKPLYHFYPGKNILSVGSVGCNLHCSFCQNWEISQTGVESSFQLKKIPAKQIIETALQEKDNIGIAYTYNEPAIWYEYMLDISKLAHERSLKNVMVTNGFINPEPLQELIKYIDAFSIDLKAFTNEFYKDLTKAKLNPVLDTIKQVKASGKHLEITNLVITNRNDNKEEFNEMIDWIVDEAGKDTVLHISKYFPTYKMMEVATPDKTLLEFYDIASAKLDYVYLGNIRSPKGQNTYCPKCESLVIERTGYSTNKRGISTKGLCQNCGNIIVSEYTI